MIEPSYIGMHRAGKLEERIEKALGLLSRCQLCPRSCGVDRISGQEGFCKTGRRARVAAADSHFGEEAPLVGKSGSGTIFFSSCNLLCSFCQNFDISHYNRGRIVDSEELARLMVALAQSGCHNINLVTPTHVVPQILEALPLAIESGLNVPLVYNSSGYDSAQTLRILAGIFDIYMPDFKFWNEKWADLFCKAPDYARVTRQAVQEMHRQVGDLVINTRGLAERGLLVRHLVMPANTSDTEEILKFISTEVSPETYVNIMDQYRPCHIAASDPRIGRRIYRTEYAQALSWASLAGLKNAKGH